MLTLLRGSNLSGLLTDENATRICSTTISQFAKSRRELSSCEATSLRLPPFFDLDTVTLASGGGAPLCVFQDPGVWIWDLHRTRSAMGWEGGVGGRRDVYIRLDVGFWVDEARVSDAFEIKNVVRARFPVHVLPPSRGRKGAKDSSRSLWLRPQRKPKTWWNYEISSQLFSRAKIRIDDRASDPVLHPRDQDYAASDMALVSRRNARIKSPGKTCCTRMTRFSGRHLRPLVKLCREIW